MYTRATKEYGVWRQNHRSRKRYAGGPTYNLVFCLGICAFVAWFIFFIVFKIRGEFYFFESSQLKLPLVSGKPDSGLFYGYRAPAVAVGIVQSKNDSVSMILDDGKLFIYPDQKNEITVYVQERSKRLELMTMITKAPSRTIGRVQFWVERDVSFNVFHEIVDLFTQIGFDEFDLAYSLPIDANKKVVVW